MRLVAVLLCLAPLTITVLQREQLTALRTAQRRRALEALIRKEDGTHADYTIPTHLVLRGSTRAI